MTTPMGNIDLTELKRTWALLQGAAGITTFRINAGNLEGLDAAGTTKASVPLPGVSDPANQGLRQVVTWLANANGFSWEDGTHTIQTVDDITDLVSIPEAQAEQDVLVYVRSAHAYYRRNDKNHMGTTADWELAKWITQPNFRIVADTAARDALRDPQDVIRGQWVGVISEGAVYSWTGDSTRFDKGWYQVAVFPPRVDIQQRQIFDPEETAKPLRWTDDRLSFEVVQSRGDLSDRTLLPASHINQGKIVFVQSEGILYELVADPTTLTDTAYDWRPLVTGVQHVGRYRDLAALPATQIMAHGQPYLVQMDMAGKELYRLFVWDDNLSSTPETPVSATTAVGPPATIDFSPITDATVYPRVVTIDLTTSGTAQAQQSASVPPGSLADDFAIAVEQELQTLAATAPITVTRAGPVVTITPTGAATIDALVVDFPAPTVQRPGNFIAVEPHVWIRDRRTDIMQQTDQQHGDFTTTIEAEHAMLHVWDDQANDWQLLFSEDEIKTWIASLSLFEGTVREVGGTAVGALDLDQLPNLWTLQSQGDLGKVSHYWVYVGQSGYVVKNAATEKAEVVAAGDEWGTIQVTTTPPSNQLPAAAGAPVQMNFEILDNAGATGGEVAVRKTWVLRLTVRNQGVAEYHEMRFDVRGDLIPMNAAAVAAMVSNTWTNQGNPLGMTVTHNTGDTFVTFQPDPQVSFEIYTQIDGGTPGVGEDLDGAILQVGDWVQIANHGGDGSGVGVNGADPDLHYVRVGGNLLTKARGDMLYGLETWAPGTYEQGSLKIDHGSIYRATRSITNADGPPSGIVSLSQPSNMAFESIGAQIDALLPDQQLVREGDWVDVIVSGLTMNPGGPFAGENLDQGDRFYYTGNPNLAGTTAVEGWDVKGGWIRVPAGATWPTAAFEITVPTATWERVDLQAGVNVANTDADLPAQDDPGAVWLVVSSAIAGGEAALFNWDAGAQAWHRLGGSGHPLNLSNGVELINVGLPVGAITAYAGQTIPDGWLLCDGSQFDQNVYADLFQVLGQATTPDLTGQFIRGGDATTHDPNTQHQDTTRLPRTAFQVSGNTSNDGNHQHTRPMRQWDVDTGWSAGNAIYTVYHGNTTSPNTSAAGNHHHTFNANVTGGDAETAPPHVVMFYIIKAADRFTVDRTP